MCLVPWNRRIFALTFLVLWCAFGTQSRAEIKTDFRMESDPKLNFPEPVKDFSPAFKSLWLAALDRPESDMQRMAAETIARGHLFSVPGLEEAIPRLEELLLSDKSHPATRFAAARALIVLESRSSADKLFQVSRKHEADLRQLIEPVLAKWNFTQIIPEWKGRLVNPDVRPRDLILALRCLSVVRDSSATPIMLAIVHDVTKSADIRLEAASAAGQCTPTGLEADATRLATSKPRRYSVDAICAVRLLARHDSEESTKLLTELTKHKDVVVVSSAFHRLLEINPALVLPLAEAAINHEDPTVRRAGASAYLKSPTPERVALVAKLLADPHPTVRREVSEAFVGIANQPEIIETIRTSIMTMLSQEAWQGHEQAALLAGTLNHQPAAGRLVELLDSPRPEVRVATAWALRKVAVPETIPGIIDKVRKQTDRRKQVNEPLLDEQVTHLCEALGVLKADAAQPLLMEYIPKSAAMGESSRCAAIWALGLINEDRRDEQLETALFGRIRDFSDTNPEDDSIKEKSALALARMKAVDQAAGIKGIALNYKFVPRLGFALRWAVKELTGEELPPVGPSFLPTGSWFLEPYAP